MKPITIIVETPKGSTQKYDYDFKIKCFKLNKVMPAGMAFPFDFGFIPGTKGEDGDPLDIIVISEFKTFTGCAISCRVIGGMKAVQKERGQPVVRNDRFLGIPEESIMFKEIRSIKDLPQHITKDLEDFFKNYNAIAGKKFNVLGLMNARKAYKTILK